jgi:uncharacterized protein YchJ
MPHNFRGVDRGSEPDAAPCSCGVRSQVRWLRLRVLGRDSGPGSHEDEAFVAFQAWFKFKDQQQQRQRGTRTETLRERRCASGACPGPSPLT